MILLMKSYCIQISSEFVFVCIHVLHFHQSNTWKKHSIWALITNDDTCIH